MSTTDHIKATFKLPQCNLRHFIVKMLPVPGKITTGEKFLEEGTKGHRIFFYLTYRCLIPAVSKKKKNNLRGLGLLEQW